MTNVGLLALSGAAFVGSHFALSHPLRAGLERGLGARGFMLLYVAVALATFAGIGHFYRPAMIEAPALLWNAGSAAWVAATMMMWAGSILFVGSLVRNPALSSGSKRPAHFAPPHGVFRITRHPMMWSFALWALVHAIVNPTLPALIVSATIGILALGGAAGQDIKKRALVGTAWSEWEQTTAFVPFGRGLASPGVMALVVGTVLWLGATFAHGALGYRPAGVWAFFA